MRLNENIAISTSRVLLVPYDAHHVQQYHRWMEDPSIREATASERLSLDEEYENQASWRESRDKLTFIVCAPLPRDGDDGDVPSTGKKGEAVLAGVGDAVDRMVGDVNLFLSPWDGDDEDQAQRGDEKETQTYYTAEIDIMIADPKFRGIGLGRAAVATFLYFVRRHLDGILAEYTGSLDTSAAKSKPRLKDVVAKINADNKASIVLFQALGFKQRGEKNYFGEIEMVFEGFGEMEEWEETSPSVMGDTYRELVYDRSRLKGRVDDE
ncbi:GNAT domain-containing protein [Daldinia vernicosa]|uniref:GNAT domain-containing protein n=1 Tax=Daldinia vernicosa TaxID=114800 RepID=UPI0020084016|nr:GNAT domain-containing protein [Daldinia vernicosa]KAI0851611.1 GNAT domain-containing protein [Daldinia vernicosa]